MSKGGFYHYFESKQQLLEEICQQRAESACARGIQAAEAAGDPIKGPKKLCMFGAPYIWGILKGTGLA